ncbi:MAG: putative integral rane prenyltransferase protein [Devosia sp.]|nr:putative integral rane prenyltransferase protein [Devosia sp.]
MSRSEQYAIHPLPAHRQPETSLEGRFSFQDLSGPEREIRATVMESPRPLVVDLDGTLIRSDLLIEAAFAQLGQRPHAIMGMFRAMREGKSVLKDHLSSPDDFDPSSLPYDETVLHYIRQARSAGRPVYLASASHERLVGAVADHLGLFEGWFATDKTTNCSGAVKAQMLVDAFGNKQFDYIGNDKADLEVWPHAAKCLAIRTNGRVGRTMARDFEDVEHLHHEQAGWKDWARLMRVHQYAKNALVFVPLITAQVFELEALLTVIIAAIAFSLCASSVYILNDLVDIRDDRSHPSKRLRPLASGAIPLAEAVLAVPILFGISIAVASAISLPFLGVLLGYFALTTAYSFVLKRMMIADVLALASLYTMRVVGGAVALGVSISPYLLAFLVAWFLSLALIKRFVELGARKKAHLADSTSRDYRNDDMFMVGALAAAAGLQAVTLFILYSTSEGAQTLYSRPELLWFVAPVLTFWLGRALMIAQRGEMHDDPVVFALKDKISIISLALAGAMVVGAM